MTILATQQSLANCHRKPKNSLWRELTNRFALARQRRSLRDLDDHLLDDIGITRAQAQSEAKKPIWQAPDHWMS